MARGDMAYKSENIGSVEILNRTEFEGVSMTIDFTSVETVDTNGVKVVKAGTPINASGVAVTATPWAGAHGILLHDVYETRPQGTILRKAYINVTRAQENSGLTYDAALAGVFPMITFEAPVIAGE